MTWQPDVEGGWSFDAGVVQLSVRPGDHGFVTWHVQWVGEAGYDASANSYESAKRQALAFALRRLKEDRKKLLAARLP